MLFFTTASRISENSSGVWQKTHVFVEDNLADFWVTERDKSEWPVNEMTHQDEPSFVYEDLN